MEKYKIVFHQDVVSKDIPRLGSAALTIKRTIHKKLTTCPEIYGHRLRGTLKGYWKLRVGNWRVVYEIHTQQVIVKGINHRGDKYETVTKRLSL